MKTFRAAAILAVALLLPVSAVLAEEVIVKPVLEPIVPTGGVAGIGAGDLLQLVDDHDPATHEDEAVYYLDKDWRRRPFPNESIYKSWYRDFSDIHRLSREDMAKFRLGKNVVFRPGTRLVKIPSVPKVYAVEPGGALRWIESEAVAKTLFGDNWNKRVDDLSETFFSDYKEGVPLAAPVWPTGTVVRQTEDGSLFLIDGYGRRALSEQVLATMHLNTVHVITAPSAALASYPDLGSVAAGVRRYFDTAQQDFIDTLPPPHVDVRAPESMLAPGKESTLASFRLVVGAPIIVRRLRLSISGPLFSGDIANLSDIHLTDEKGNDLFGIAQLGVSPGATQATLEFSGAYTIENASVSFVHLRAKTAAGMPADARFTIAVDRAGLTIVDGTNSDRVMPFSPVTPFVPVTASVGTASASATAAGAAGAASSY